MGRPSSSAREDLRRDHAEHAAHALAVAEQVAAEAGHAGHLVREVGVVAALELLAVALRARSATGGARVSAGVSTGRSAERHDVAVDAAGSAASPMLMCRSDALRSIISANSFSISGARPGRGGRRDAPWPRATGAAAGPREQPARRHAAAARSAACSAAVAAARPTRAPGPRPRSRSATPRVPPPATRAPSGVSVGATSWSIVVRRLRRALHLALARGGHDHHPAARHQPQLASAGLHRRLQQPLDRHQAPSVSRVTCRLWTRCSRSAA